MQEPTEKELLLIDQLKQNLSDLCIDKHHLEAKNLLRFLRARSLSIRDAETMFRRQIEWRTENDADCLVEWDFPKDYKAYWPWALTGFDAWDGPVVLIEFGKWDPSKVGGNYNDFVKYIFYSMESVWSVMRIKGQGKKTHRQFSVILDLKGLSFRTVTTIDAMQGILEGVKVFEANYPETLRVGLIVNAPYVFEIAWRLIKPFVSEYTHMKLRFLGSDPKAWREELVKYMAEDQFPEKYGGILPDSKELTIKNGCAIVKNSNMTNSNDYICDNLMKQKA